MQDSLIKEP